jgi:hypothetical protein
MHCILGANVHLTILFAFSAAQLFYDYLSPLYVSYSEVKRVFLSCHQLKEDGEVECLRRLEDFIESNAERHWPFEMSQLVEQLASFE